MQVLLCYIEQSGPSKNRSLTLSDESLFNTSWCSSSGDGSDGGSGDLGGRLNVGHADFLERRGKRWKRERIPRLLLFDREATAYAHLLISLFALLPASFSDQPPRDGYRNGLDSPRSLYLDTRASRPAHARRLRFSFNTGSRQAA